jgi:ATP-binding cassette, subfamily C (CFTR/MRP), member 1
VDVETDSKIQQTIQTEFKGKTLICIARESILLNAYMKEIYLLPM